MDIKYEKIILPNGVRLIVVPMIDNPTVTFSVSVGTGSYNEKTSKRGLSHFLEHMCFKGTSKRPNATYISKELDSIGAHYNAFTGTEVTCYYAKADKKHFEKIGDIITDIYKNSIFPEAEIAKEKNVVKGEIDMYADDPQEIISDALRGMVYKNEICEVSILGTKESVDSIERADLIEYKKSQYVANNTIITISGGIETEVAKKFVEENFSDLMSGDFQTQVVINDRKQNDFESVFLEKDTDQAHMIFLWRAIGRFHKDRAVAMVIRAILSGGMSSRLFTRLRDELGSGYYVGANYNSDRSGGQFVIYTGTEANRVPEISSEILSIVEKLKNELVSDEELDKVKEMIRSGIYMSIETSDGRADFITSGEILFDKINSPKEIEDMVFAVTKEDIKRLSNEIFTKDKMSFGVIGKDIDKSAVLKALSM